MATDFDSLPVLKTFQELKLGDKVYSKKYGLGKVVELYGKDEVIIDFNDPCRFSQLAGLSPVQWPPYFPEDGNVLLDIMNGLLLVEVNAL